MKKALGLGARGVSHKWSAIRPRARALMERCLESSGDASTISTEMGRWAPPVPTQPSHAGISKVSASAVLDPVRALPPVVQLLICHYRRQLHKAFPAIDCTVCFSRELGDLAGGLMMCKERSFVYLPVDKNFTETTLAVASVIAVGDGGDRYFRFHDPLAFDMSWDVLCELHDDAKLGGRAHVVKHVVQWLWDDAGESGDDGPLGKFVLEASEVVLTADKDDRPPRGGGGGG
eukprot:9493815-Pyramimonas_sp.AAC.1